MVSKYSPKLRAKTAEFAKRHRPSKLKPQKCGNGHRWYISPRDNRRKPAVFEHLVYTRKNAGRTVYRASSLLTTASLAILTPIRCVVWPPGLWMGRVARTDLTKRAGKGGARGDTAGRRGDTGGRHVAREGATTRATTREGRGGCHTKDYEKEEGS